MEDPLPNESKGALQRLRELLGDRTERAYKERDAQRASGQADAYAAGEAHAYGVAQDDIQDAQKRGE